ncbi:MAG: hypothetical protein IKF36_03970 [Bacilli bacterium]|nr:hypothetical protein [Bacilli bacterium]
MNSIENKNRLFIISFISFIILYFSVVFTFFQGYSSIISAIFILTIALISYIIYDFKIFEFSTLNKKIIKLVAVGLLIYFSVIYLLGIFTGYGRDVFSSDFFSILKNSIMPFISVLCLEFFRYNYVSNNKDNKSTIYFMTFLIIIFDLILNIYRFDITAKNIFIYITVTMLPIVIKNIMLTYLTKKVGYYPCIVYVIPLCLYTYICTYKPMLGNYLTSICNIVLPSLIFIYSYRYINNFDKDKKNISIVRLVIDIVLIIFFTIVIGLISGFFKYYLIGVEKSTISGINKGDAIMINQKVSYEDYHIDDIVAYKENNKIVIEKITKVENGKIYVTKEIDQDKKETYKEISKESVLGKYVDFRIGKIAYPTIWFKNLVGGDLNE